MTLAMRKLHGLGWVALVFLVAILLYPLSLQVASVHSDLVKTERHIIQARREISYLQADVRTLANHAQLEEWNRVQYGYDAPRAEQYLEGERALANLGGEQIELRPVLVSVSDSLGGVAPSGVIGHKVARMDDAPTHRADSEEPREKVSVPIEEKPLSAKLADGRSDHSSRPSVERLAQMETKLIAPDVLREIGRQASLERSRR